MSVISDKLAGLSIVISGTFSHHSRDEYKAMIEANGGKNVGSVSKKTSFILAGENMGPEKRKKAEDLGIPLKTEEEFLTVENLPPSLKGDLQQEEDIRDFLLLVNVTVSEMPEQRRRVFCLSRKDGLKNKEIAQLTGLSEKTVEYHISKALAQLKSL